MNTQIRANRFQKPEVRRAIAAGILVGVGALLTGLLLAFGGPFAAAAAIIAFIAAVIIGRGVFSVSVASQRNRFCVAALTTGKSTR